eukprot:gene2742-3037_t
MPSASSSLKLAAKAAKLGSKAMLKKAAAGKGAVVLGKGAVMAGKGAAVAGKAGAMVLKGAGIFFTAAATVNVTENVLKKDTTDEQQPEDSSSCATDNLQGSSQPAGLGWLGPAVPGLSSAAAEPGVARPRGSLFDQILSRGSYRSKVDADLAAHRSNLVKLAYSVTAFKPADMPAVVQFVNHHQRSLLDLLYDERAVLKHVPDWPAAKWEAMWEAVVVYRQMHDMQRQCRELQCATAAAAGTGSSSSSTLVAAAGAAVKLYGQVTQNLESYQRQESAFDQRMRAQGVPWKSHELVMSVKEAAVNLGTVYVTAVLRLVEEGQQRLLQQEQK